MKKDRRYLWLSAVPCLVPLFVAGLVLGSRHFATIEVNVGEYPTE